MGDVLRQEQQRATSANEVMNPVRMVITSRPQQDRRYDDPTTTEVAAVYAGEEEAPPNSLTKIHKNLGPGSLLNKNSL